MYTADTPEKECFVLIPSVMTFIYLIRRFFSAFHVCFVVFIHFRFFSLLGSFAFCSFGVHHVFREESLMALWVIKLPTIL